MISSPSSTVLAAERGGHAGINCIAHRVAARSIDLSGRRRRVGSYTGMVRLVHTAQNFNLPIQTLGSTGTYKVVVDPTGANTGNINVQVTSP